MRSIYTPCRSQYFAWQLSRRMGADSADLLACTLVDAQVDSLNVANLPMAQKAAVEGFAHYHLFGGDLA